MASAEIADNYTGRVLQRSPFRTLLGRRRTTGSGISSVLTGLRRLPPQPVRAPEPRNAPVPEVPPSSA
jgi:hypothetical protein